MRITLLKAVLALLPALALLSGALVLFLKRKAFAFFVQLFGAGCLRFCLSPMRPKHFICLLRCTGDWSIVRVTTSISVAALLV
jgi:hypothetical protein